jgi:hypothetical protein
MNSHLSVYHHLKCCEEIYNKSGLPDDGVYRHWNEAEQ